MRFCLSICDILINKKRLYFYFYIKLLEQRRQYDGKAVEYCGFPGTVITDDDVDLFLEIEG